MKVKMDEESFDEFVAEQLRFFDCALEGWDGGDTCAKQRNGIRQPFCSARFLSNDVFSFS